MLAWVPFLYMAARTRARKFAVLTGVYILVTVLAGVMLALKHGDNSALNTAGGFVLILLAGGGCAHVLSLRREYGRELTVAEDPRLLEAEHADEVRERALRIVATNPKRALELGIGRPDVPGSFDAGLIDVNHAGPESLHTLPGIDAERAKRIVELRMNGSGFESAEDLDMVVDLEPGTLAELRRRAVFLPRY
jgi:hypothetical protein